MNENILPIYNLIRRSISAEDSKIILGDTIAIALYNFYKTNYGEANVNFDFSKLICESLDNEIFNNDDFIDTLILDILDDSFIQKILSELKLNEEVNFKAREDILKTSKKRLTNVLIKVIGLNEEYFIEEDKSQVTIDNELITPFSPIDRSDPDIEIPKEFLSLHPYQKRVKDIATRTLLENKKKRFLIHMPTGSGKTKTSVESIIDYLRTEASEEGFILWFAHSKELCEQSYDTLKNMWQFRGDASIDFYKVFGDTKLNTNIFDKKRAVLFIGFQKFHSLLNSPKEDALQFRTKIANQAKLVVVDEAHKSLAPTFLRSIDYCVDNFDDCKLIGLTATPGRTNEDSPENEFLANYFGNNLISIQDEDGVERDDPIKYLQENAILANIEDEILGFDINVDLKALNLSSENSEELSKKQLDLISKASIINADRNIAILNCVKDSLSDPNKESILIFAGSTEHCIILKMIFDREDIESDYILGSTNKNKRAELIQKFKNKELKVLINFGVLSTGFDAPKLNSLIIARTINSNILGSQIIGRALRGPKNGGNEKNYITVLKDNITGTNNPSFLFSYWEDFWK